MRLKKNDKCPAELVKDFFGGDEEKAGLWWMTPNPLLGGLRPHDMVKTSRGENKLERFIRNSTEDNKPPDVISPRDLEKILRQEIGRLEKEVQRLREKRGVA